MFVGAALRLAHQLRFLKRAPHKPTARFVLREEAPELPAGRLGPSAACAGLAAAERLEPLVMRRWGLPGPGPTGPSLCATAFTAMLRGPGPWPLADLAIAHALALKERPGRPPARPRHW
jgi:hypothetical protein